MGQQKKTPLICGIAYDAYLEKVKQFHGYAAPGLLLGGFLVDLAYQPYTQKRAGHRIAPG